MKISRLIQELSAVQEQEGDIEVTCTGSNLPDGFGEVVQDVFETTVENLIVRREPGVFGDKHVRLYL